MSHPIVLPILFGAHALPTGLAEDHARHGNHLRLHHHPLLGLPVAPFFIERAVVQGTKSLKRRNTAYFYAGNQELIPPFNVAPGTIVKARIAVAPGETCIWAQLNATPPRDTVPVVSPNDPPIRVAVPIRPSIAVAQPVTRPIRTIRDLGLTRFGVQPAAASAGLRVSAYVSAASGPALIGRRSQPRYAFSGPGLIELQIEGSGTVYGLEWIEARDNPRLNWEPFTVLALPHKGGARYMGITDPDGAAQARVKTQAPKRRPLQDALGAPAPGSAPLFTESEEIDRVASLCAKLSDDLEPLINDLSAPQLAQETAETIRDASGKDVGTAKQLRIQRVFQHQSDPGAATHLGYKVLDEKWVEHDDTIIFYRANGYFRDFQVPASKDRPFSELLFDLMVNAIPQDSRTISRDQIHEIASSGAGRSGFKLVPGSKDKLDDVREYIAISCIAVADRGAPLDPVDTPAILKAEHQDWLPTSGSTPIRSIDIGIGGVMVAGLVAAQKRTPPTGGGSFAALNRRNNDGWHVPIVLGLGVDVGGTPAPPPGAGTLTDDRGDAGPIRYLVAQQDRFGRFSDWTARNAAEGPRPRPPRPDVTAYYTPVPVANAATAGGPVEIHVPVPDDTALAPASFPLDRVRLTIRDQRFGTTTTIEPPVSGKVPIPTQPGMFRIKAIHTGPILDAMEERFLQIIATWIDTAGQLSEPSEPFLLRLRDLRPPPQITVPDRLQYSARPDVTGLAWIEHRWAPQAGQSRYGVYYSDENRLTAHIASINRTDILTALGNAADAAARATIWRTHQALLPDHLFEKLDDVIRDTSTGKAFRHAVSGSLRVLSVYKIAAETASGAKPLLGDLPIILYGVPNADPPPRPLVSVSPTSAEPGEHDTVAEVTIRVAPGATAGETWRLRRTATAGANPQAMPIVTTGSFGPVDAVTGEQVATFRDDGPLVIADTARLRPWFRYAWVAEVQGQPESGSVAAGTPVPGLWSAPSNAVSLIIVPPTAPPAPAITAITGTTTAGGLTSVSVAISHPGPLQGGELGSFTVRLIRRLPGAPPAIVHEGPIAVDGNFTLAGTSTGEVAPENTEYSVIIIDPIGRSSPVASALLELV